MLPEYSSLTLALLVGLWALLPLIIPERRFWRAVVLLPMILVQIYYAKWRYLETLSDFNLSAPVLWQYLFFTTEMLVVLYGIWQCITLIRYTERTEQCDKLISSFDGNRLKSADLFIPTYSESRKILQETISAAKKDNYPDLTIWICDDGGRDWLREMCAAQGVKYLSRPTARALKTKAANLRWSIPHGKADYIVCLDADFQSSDVLTTRLTSFLDDPEIGLVQAPQHFRNPDPVQ